jgi:hypothetical protein
VQLLADEGRRRCYLSFRRRVAPVLLLADEGHGKERAGQGLRQGGSWCAGQRRRTEASSYLSRDAGTKKRKGFFSIHNE